MHKPAITGLAPPSGIDDVIKPLAKGLKKAAKKKKPVKNDVRDPKYKKNPYNKKGGMTKDYKDYVLRNSRGDY